MNLKKKWFLFFLIAVPLMLNSQESTEKKVFVKLNLEYLSGLSYNIENDNNLFDYDSKNFELGIGVRISPQFSSSINIGANRYEKLSANTFPLTLQADYYLRSELSSFFGTLKAGPQIKLSDASDNGYIFAVHLGRRFKVKNNFALKGYVGFNHQKTTDEYLNIGKITRNSFVIGVEVPIF